MNKDFTKVSCVGDEKSKHPLIYIMVPENKSIKCPYCAKEFFSTKTNTDSEH